ncbi:IPExxxVDY family protein [Cellulophaga sp. HaHaR_3_176]|nr:IPExxxVDY family protein [Cellulophaga sp. HaHaR_3_176]
MVATHKMSLDFYEDSFALIAMHCSLEDFTLAYTINKHLKCGFKRRKQNLVFSDNLSLPIFEWKDTINDRYWTLISNSVQIEDINDNNGFFADVPSQTKKHLIPEYKNVDYFIKLEQEDLESEEDILKSILAIPKIITAYTVNTDALKSKNNLIF